VPSPREASRVTPLLFLLALSACNAPPNASAPVAAIASPAAETAPSTAGDWFVDRAADAGLTTAHVNGMSGRFYYPEIIGPGAALFDYDNDGDLDVYLVQGQMLGEDASVAAAQPSTGRLFRNDLTGGPGTGPAATSMPRFTDVTAASGIAARGYGMGVATGDIDNDGCVDLYLTSLGANQLFRNNCTGTFSDVSRASRTDDPSWSVSAAFLDYDRDGWLDLFVGNYLSWRAAASTPCFVASGRRDYCSPNVYMPQPSRLYHNDHDGTFSDVSARSGIARDFGPALGISTADFNGDGWIDVYVANDGQPNQLWINQKNGTFTNMGLLSGTALSAHGKAKAGMGVDAGDVDNDGDEDLFVSNLTGEGNDLYVNDGAALFEERSASSNLGVASRGYTGFGTTWFDIDNDGWLDTLIANGAVQGIEALTRTNDPLPLHQRKLLFRNLGGSGSTGVRFDDVSARGGAAFALSEVGRGAAFGDIDNDGDTDVIVANNNGTPRLLINAVGNRHHWIGLRLVGATAPRDMLGARVSVVKDDGSVLWRRAHSDGSYASASDPRVLVGLGTATHVARVRVLWPGGASEEWRGVEVDRYTTLREGTSK
jgi:hypothetical protein